MADEAWTIKRCLDWTQGYLGEHGDGRSRLSAEWLLSSVTGLNRTELYMNYDEPLSPDELARMHTAVARRAKGEPLQYIAGETSFRTITVACEPGVLIPRPETEVLVEEVLSYLDREVLGSGPDASTREHVSLPWNDEVEAARKREVEEAARKAAEGRESAPAAEDAWDAGGSGGHTVFGAVDGDESFVPVALEAEEGMGTAPEVCESGNVSGTASEEGGAAEDAPTARVLEVGCGTGCISLSLATERPRRVTCIATDIEPKAVALSERNREALGLSAREVEFREGNLVAPLDRETEWGTFDVLVSNPPYVPTPVMATLPYEVAAFEPALALDGGQDGLAIFRRLLNAAPYMLREGGLFACELYEESLDTAKTLCEQAGMEDVRVARDLAGRPRIILARVVEAKRYQL